MHSNNQSDMIDSFWISSTISNPHDQSNSGSAWQDIKSLLDDIDKIAGWNILIITSCITILFCFAVFAGTAHLYRRRNKRKSNEAALEQQHMNDAYDDDVIDIEMNIVKEEEGNSRNRFHFICYLLICIFWGNMSSLPGSLFADIKNQLELGTDSETTDIFTAQQIGGCISSIITAIIIDKLVNTHRWIGLLLFNGSICLLFIPFVKDIYSMYLLWISVGFTQGAIEVAIPVFIFRSFSNSDIWMLLLSIQCLSKTVSPPIISFAIDTFGDYFYSLLLFSVIALSSCLFLLCLTTPKHDEYRSIKLELEKTGSSKSPQEVMQEMMSSNRGKTSKYGLIALFCLFFIIYAMLPSSMTNFIAIYCEEYLNQNEDMGRNLICTFFGGQLLYYFGTLILCRKCESTMNDKRTFLLLLLGQIICVSFGIIWIFIIPFDLILFGSFIIFASIGYILSFTYPTIYNLCESIVPINGIISCIFTLSQGIGNVIMLQLMGELLITYYGIHILPYPITISSLILIILTLSILFVHNKYKNQRNVLLFKVNTLRRFSTAVF